MAREHVPIGPGACRTGYLHRTGCHLSPPRCLPQIKYMTNGFRPHFELLEMIGAVEFDAGREAPGSCSGKRRWSLK